MKELKNLNLSSSLLVPDALKFIKLKKSEFALYGFLLVFCCNVNDNYFSDVVQIAKFLVNDIAMNFIFYKE